MADPIRYTNKRSVAIATMIRILFALGARDVEQIFELLDQEQPSRDVGRIGRNCNIVFEFWLAAEKRMIPMHLHMHLRISSQTGYWQPYFAYVYTIGPEDKEHYRELPSLTAPSIVRTEVSINEQGQMTFEEDNFPWDLSKDLAKAVEH